MQPLFDIKEEHFVEEHFKDERPEEERSEEERYEGERSEGEHEHSDPEGEHSNEEPRGGANGGDRSPEGLESTQEDVSSLLISGLQAYKCLSH